MSNTLYREHEDYLRRSRGFDGSREQFENLVSEALALTGLKPQDVADLLEAAPGTIECWAEGIGAPAKFLRPKILMHFRRLVRRHQLDEQHEFEVVE